MDQEILLAAKRLLENPPRLEEIPIQRAVYALGVSALTLGHHHTFYYAEYLIYPSNLYLAFDGYAAKDENGNFDSPIFQNNGYNSFKPLWQEFRERVEEKLGTSVSHVFFGDYKIRGNDEFFTVKNEPKDCRWRYTKKPTKDSVFITSISKAQAQEYQNILDELRLNRAIKIVEAHFAREQSRACRKEAIIALDSEYNDEFERFTLDAETFRFRQFNTEFLYTPEGLSAFAKFYHDVCEPYRNDEIVEMEWKEKSRQLEDCLLDDDRFGPEFRLGNALGFKLLRLDNGRCEVESDLVDDRTGHPFHMTVKSQKFDDILNAVASELVVVFQRKQQYRRATAVLQSLASKE